MTHTTDAATTGAFLGRLVDCVSDAIVVLDRDMRIRFANTATRTILTGSEEGELTGTALDYVHPDDLDEIAGAFAELLRGPAGSHASSTMRVLTAHGDLPVQAMATNLADDPVVEGVVVCFRNLAGEVAFRTQADMLRSAVEAATDVIVILGADGAVLHANRAAVRLLGGRQPAHVDELGPEATRMLLRDVALPMARRTGCWTGEATLAGCGAGDEPPLDVSLVVSAIRDDSGRVGALSVIARDTTEHKLIEATLRRQTRVDTLTGLLNRGGLMDELAALVARCGPYDDVGVLFIDLDHFKVANDSIGHAHGDELLRLVAERLDAAAYPGVLARYGGDEFVALVPRVRHTADLVGIAETVCASLAEPIHLAGYVVHLSCSIGVTTARRDARPDDVLRAADLAMYRAKERGRNRWELFNPSLRDAADRRLQLQSQLHDAVQGAELSLRYQPIFDLAGEQLTGFEALVRWCHPSGRLLAPAEFFDVAQQARLMATIDDWVLHEACTQLATWRRRHPRARHLTMAVNLSSEQLARPELREMVREQLGAAGIPPEHVVVEITEHQLIDDIDATTTRLRDLRELGVAIGLDDFGTDHSSLSYLGRLPIDLLKIDRTFLVHAGERAGATVVRAVAALARDLGLVCVAEGVETHPQVELLRVAGVDRAQGHLFAPALAAHEAEDVLVRELARSA